MIRLNYWLFKIIITCKADTKSKVVIHINIFQLASDQTVLLLIKIDDIERLCSTLIYVGKLNQSCYNSFFNIN